MEAAVYLIFLFSCFLLLFQTPSSSLPLCTNLRAPVMQKKPLAFCPYNGSVCCDSSKDLQLQKQFEAMNISDPACASSVKSILCATCDPFSAELYGVESRSSPIPFLCNSTSSGSSRSSLATTSYCSTVWDTCQKTSILNSPFAPSLQEGSNTGIAQNSTSTTLTDLWQSKTDFCGAFGGVSDKDSICFDGEPVSLNKSDTLPTPKGLCLERIDGGTSYLNMVPHPDGSNRAFISNQEGKVWLADVPEQDSGKLLGLDQSSPFVDLTDQVHYDINFGMMGMAFHPNFAKNGRFFASFNCDKVKSTECSGRCACNSDVGCDPSKLPVSSPDDHPCQFHTVIAEYSANGTASEPSMAKNAKPTEVRRIFTMGLPSTSSHGGQILFGPADGYMYIMTGDGKSKGDNSNYAQNKKSLLGKIMRVDVDNIPSRDELAKLDSWGNYSIPKDNPYTGDKQSQPEIWAQGLRNPWRCSFDSERPSYFLCADVGQDQYEEVDVITKGGNYGWPVYEGPILFSPQQSAAGNNSSATPTSTLDLIFPVVGYNHSEVKNKVGSAAISGGYFYRSTTDPCTHGSYLYADLYASDIWAAAETPEGSGNFTAASIPFTCAQDSPMNCSYVPNSPAAALGYIFSFGQDNRKDVFILASTGVYRVVRPSRCNYSCSKEQKSIATNPNRNPPSPSNGHVTGKCMDLMLFLSAFLMLLEFILL